MIRRGALLLAISLLLAPQALAEVFVLTGSHGEFKGFSAAPRTDGTSLLYWQTTIKLPNRDYLNLNGDNTGDHGPAYVVIPAGQLFAHPTPVVVWSHVEGINNDLVSSVWREGFGWSSPLVFNQRNTVPDLAVSLTLDPLGGVHAVWSTETPIRSIWYSKFASGSWSDPERVSNKDEDSRNPSLTIVANKLFIAYEVWARLPVEINSFLKEDFD